MATSQSPAVLAVLVRHPSVYNDQRLVMQLLRVSNSARAAVLEHCIGLVPITAKRNSPKPNFYRMERQVKQFKQWVARFGPIMCSLDMALPVDNYDSLAFSLKIAAAAAPQGKLQLQAFKGARVSTTMLRSLGNFCNLRSLELGISCQGEEYGEACYEALATLTNLEHLRLHGQTAEQFLQGASALSKLTALEILSYHSARDCSISSFSGFADTTEVKIDRIERFLPNQLQQLTLDLGSNERCRKPLQLQHLTALTALNVDSGYRHPSLPCSLQHLTLSHFETDSLQPLLALRRLQTLRINHCCCTQQQLRQLGRTLQQLTAVELSYIPIEDYDYYNDAARSWPVLPMRGLNMIVWRAGLPHSTLRALRQLQGLTRLCVESEGRFWVPCSKSICQCLSSLTALQELKLLGLQILPHCWDEDISESGSHGATNSIDSEQTSSEYDSSDFESDSGSESEEDRDSFPLGVLGMTGGSEELGYEDDSGQESVMCAADCECPVCEAVSSVAAAAGCSGDDSDMEHDAESATDFACVYSHLSRRYAPLLRHIAGLPQLKNLTLGRMPLCASVQALADATQLSCLQLYKVGMDSDHAAHLVLGLKQLRFNTSWAETSEDIDVMRRFIAVDPAAAAVAGAVVQLVGTADAQWESRTARRLARRYPNMQVLLPPVVDDWV